MTRYRYWQVMHFVGKLRLYRKSLITSVLFVWLYWGCCLMIFPRTYEARAVVLVRDLCPHGIVMGDPIYDMGKLLFRMTDEGGEMVRTSCTQCRELASNQPQTD